MDFRIPCSKQSQAMHEPRGAGSDGPCSGVNVSCQRSA